MLKSLVKFFQRTAANNEGVGDWLLNDRFNTFLQDPSPQNYLKLRKLVLADKAYRVSSSELEDVSWLIRHLRYLDAWNRLRDLGPARLLSPKTHRMAAELARILGERESEHKENLIYHRCIEGLLGTGDGTRSQPYLLTHAGDEFDLIDHLDRKVGRHSLVLDNGRSLECVECQDGSELWFDLTDLHARLDAPPKLSKPSRSSRSRL